MNTWMLQEKQEDATMHTFTPGRNFLFGILNKLFSILFTFNVSAFLIFIHIFLIAEKSNIVVSIDYSKVQRTEVGLLSIFTSMLCLSSYYTNKL